MRQEFLEYNHPDGTSLSDILLVHTGLVAQEKSKRWTVGEASMACGDFPDDSLTTVAKTPSHSGGGTPWLPFPNWW